MTKEKSITTLMIILCLVSIIALPIEAEAKTITQFQNEVNNYTQELQEKKNKLAKNEKEVAEIKNKIATIETQIKEAETEIDALEKEIDKSNKEIAKKSKESKAIMEYYQVSNGENVYLEYVFGAKDITDMIYRLSIVEQLTEYNDKVMKELKELIAKNEKKQKELESKKVELSALQKDLEDQKDRINADSASIRVGLPGLEEQIRAAKSNLSYYKSLGCGANEDISACQYRIMQSSGGGSVPSTNGFFRPMIKGWINRGLSWNNSSGSGSHMGYDLDSSNDTEPIYPIADGQLFFVGYDSAGALIVKIRHNYKGSYIYSTYAHLSSFSGAVRGYVNYSRGTSASISNGPIISAHTQIGNMGNTGNSFGAHLHLEMTSCDWHKGGGCTWETYKHRVLNPSNYVSLPSRWSNR